MSADAVVPRVVVKRVQDTYYIATAVHIIGQVVTEFILVPVPLTASVDNIVLLHQNQRGNKHIAVVEINRLETRVRFEERYRLRLAVFGVCDYQHNFNFCKNRGYQRKKQDANLFFTDIHWTQGCMS